MSTNYIPFIPKNSDGLQTSIGDDFYVKGLYDEDVVRFILYKNTAEPNRVNKESYLTEVGEISGVFRDATSITDLTVTIEYDRFIDFNYIHIPILNRYYFVTDVKIINNKLYELDLSVDPLMTYKDALLGLRAFVDRNEFDFNKDIIDKNRTVEQGIDITIYELNNWVFDLNELDSNQVDNAYTYVLNGYKIDAEYAGEGG